MHNFDVHWRDRKSNNVMHYVSTGISQYFNSNLQQFIWIQFIIVLDTTILKKMWQGGQPLSSDLLSLMHVGK